MPLFIVRHQHDPEACPAADPYHGANLLNHLSRPNVRKHGVTMQAEAVARGEHTVYMIVEAADQNLVLDFMAPFALAGTLDVYPASTCAGVVSRGGCGVEDAAEDETTPALDPEEACQQAIEDGLVVHRAHPLNGEISVPDLIGGVVMPNARFYIRNHFQIPKLSRENWRLRVHGLVDNPLSLSSRDIANLPSQAKVVTLECAGNGRSTMEPRTSGEQWNLGAVSTAEWTGVPLLEVLNRAGVQPNAKHIVFRGADSGLVEGHADPIFFERSLSLDEARFSEALLAYAMNGEALPLQHGFPLRVIVPSWYAVASVKWLTEIEVIDRPFEAFYQTERYYIDRMIDGHVEREPLRLQRVRSLITEPASHSCVDRGELVVRGVAWSGAAPIAGVKVKLNDGPWREARLLGDRKRHSWQWWELLTRVDEPGDCVIRARATDLDGRVQPETPEWNHFGYCNNALRPVHIAVR
ncbi:sulfite oxidase [uncultured Paludibaculum sp.]|uniref:sulfite oxidase n=1 Tax=uncultured Paludibaculum sp. TaxID=1765020 RepID=UPI002AABF778|nr:sulfite oxidase [uncultured Paludibaculum sp.]